MFTRNDRGSGGIEYGRTGPGIDHGGSNGQGTNPHYGWMWYDQPTSRPRDDTTGGGLWCRCGLGRDTLLCQTTTTKFDPTLHDTGGYQPTTLDPLQCSRSDRRGYE